MSDREWSELSFALVLSGALHVAAIGADFNLFGVLAYGLKSRHDLNFQTALNYNFYCIIYITQAFLLLLYNIPACSKPAGKLFQRLHS